MVVLSHEINGDRDGRGDDEQDDRGHDPAPRDRALRPRRVDDLPAHGRPLCAWRPDSPPAAASLAGLDRQAQGVVNRAGRDAAQQFADRDELEAGRPEAVDQRGEHLDRP